MKKTICVPALLIVLALTATALSFAEGNALFPKTYELSPSDIERYQNIMQAIVGKEPSWLRHGALSLEEKAQFDLETFGEDREEGIFYNTLPTEADIPKEQALFLAYAAMEDKYGYNDDVLCLFYPDYYFLRQMKTIPFGRWGFIRKTG